MYMYAAYVRTYEAIGAHERKYAAYVYYLLLYYCMCMKLNYYPSLLHVKNQN